MLKELNKKPLKKNLLWAVLLIALAVIFLAAGDFGIFTLIKGPVALEELSAEELEGRYVETDVNFIWEAYAYYGDTRETATEIHYMVASQPVQQLEDAVDCSYIGLIVHESRLEDFENSYEKGTLAWNNRDSSALPKALQVRGVVRQMTQDEYDYYAELAEESGMTELDIVPLVLDDGALATENAESVLPFTVIAGVLLFIAVFKLVRSLTGTYQRDIRRYCAASPDADYTLQRLEDFYASAEPLTGGIRANQEWLLFSEGYYTRLLECAQVAWVYSSTVQHRTNGIPTGKTFSLTLRDKAGKKYNVPMRREADTQEAAHQLFELLPCAVFGYDTEREKLFQQDRAAFEALAKEQHNPTEPASEPETVACTPES